ncbi:TPA: hypothetical protein PFD71_003256 [Vibrio cholerae]|nr:hypothetical protein [Vibrio cholerae]
MTFYVGKCEEENKSTVFVYEILLNEPKFIGCRLLEDLESAYQKAIEVISNKRWYQKDYELIEI